MVCCSAVSGVQTTTGKSAAKIDAETEDFKSKWLLGNFPATGSGWFVAVHAAYVCCKHGNLALVPKRRWNGDVLCRQYLSPEGYWQQCVSMALCLL
jgi:hypothetical protein